METKRANLLAAMAIDFDVDSRVRTNLQELLYTASETGVIEHSLSAEDAFDVVQIYNLALNLATKGQHVPNELRM